MSEFQVEANQVKFQYLTDPKNPGRRVTIARALDKNNSLIHFSFAVCLPSKYWPSGGLKQEGDTFTRKRGREIALGRLQKTSPKFYRVIPLTSEHPTESIIQALSSYLDVPRCVKSIAKAHQPIDITCDH